MSDTPSFTNLVPGFDFLQNLVKNAGSAMPAMGQWIAPTLNPEELDKRIGELRTVQFWLEQNARMLAATIQALEVQRMTLSTLKTMNVQMGDLRDSLHARATGAAASTPPAPEAAPAEPPAPEKKTGGKAAAPDAAASMVDPVQWWGALTKQFTQLAANAMHEPAGTPVGEPAKAAPAKTARKTATGTAARKRAAPKR
ncbi:MAG: PhaM family polyhydroxyalkanoate granule multifunctional regulatory protein [Rhizobacter sp.]|jgi:hypothetical protein